MKKRNMLLSHIKRRKYAVGIFLSLAIFCAYLVFMKPILQPISAHDAKLNQYFEELRFAKNEVEAEAIENKLYIELSAGNSPSVAVLYEAALKQSEERQYVAAIENFETVQKLEPQFVAAFVDGAFVAFEMGDKRRALSWLQTATIIEPRHFAAWQGLGTLYEDMGDGKKAQEAYQNAIYHNPNLKDAERGIFRINAATKGIDF